MDPFIKDPDAELDYSVDWTDFLTNENVISSSWVILPADLTEISSSFTTTKATIFVSGGVAGRSYTLTNSIVTNSTIPRKDDRTIIIKVQEK